MDQCFEKITSRVEKINVIVIVLYLSSFNFKCNLGEVTALQIKKLVWQNEFGLIWLKLSITKAFAIFN